MAGLKITVDKSAITRRLKTLGISKKEKALYKDVATLIELDDRITRLDGNYKKHLEEVKVNMAKYKINKDEYLKIERIFLDAISERDYLSRLFDATCGKSWTRRTNWKTVASLNKWYGVKTACRVVRINRFMVIRMMRVVELDLRNNYLHAHVAKGSSGVLPDDICKLEYLEKLNLGYNFIAGKLPSTLGKLCKLKVLHMHFNQLEGGLPSLNNMISLTELYLNNNHLEGNVDELVKLRNMKTCHIYQNKFSGTVPEQLALSKLLKAFKSYKTFLKYGPKVTARAKQEKEWHL